MQEAELNGHFARLESKLDHNVNRATTTTFASMDMELQYQSAQAAVLLLEQSTLRTRRLAELKAILLAERIQKV